MDNGPGNNPDTRPQTERDVTSRTPQPSTSDAPSKVQQPKPQALPSRGSPSAILVSTRQKGNPILNHVKLSPWEYADIPADYVVGNTTCALFLSLKYHRLHPEYIYARIRLLGGKYNLRIVLIMVDIPNHEDSLKELSKTSIINNLTLILCWSAPEAAHYLELFKSSENAQPTAIRTQQAQSYKDSLVDFVTVPRTVNKSDAASLISTFGSLQNAVNAQPEQISSVPGWGEKKVRQWCNAVREDFRVETSKKATAPREDKEARVGSLSGKDILPGRNDMDSDEEAQMAEAEATQTEAQKGEASSHQGEGVSEGIKSALENLRGGG
ncbi:mating-type switching protein swi10 [Aspergillus sp. HF37]|nr:mating-type switching protein swi10 [Aspergillus sp. HF37]